MQWVVTLLLLRSFFEAWALSSKSQFNHVLLLFEWGSFAADFYNALHVTSFRANQTTCYLELLIIIYLNIKSACILNILILHLLSHHRLIAKSKWHLRLLQRLAGYKTRRIHVWIATWSWALLLERGLLQSWGRWLCSGNSGLARIRLSLEHVLWGEWCQGWLDLLLLVGIKYLWLIITGGILGTYHWFLLSLRI